MGRLTDVVNWFREVGNWNGSDGAVARLGEHTQISTVAVVAALVIALPPAIWLGHKRRFGTLAINVSNVGRALPSFAILVLGTQLAGLLEVPVIGSVSVFVALVLLAIPPIVTNAYVGVAEVADEVRDAARGMGLDDHQVLRRVELPLAVPLIMAGVRTSAVQVVATATIAAQLGFGGLGRFIIDGYSTRDYTEVLAGAVLVAGLGLVTEGLLGLIQRALTPRGLRSAAREARATERNDDTVEPTAEVDPAVVVPAA